MYVNCKMVKKSSRSSSPGPKKQKQNKKDKLRAKKKARETLLFGKDFKVGMRYVNCSIGFLLLNGLLNRSGTIEASPLQMRNLPKQHMWSYIYYLQYHNRNIAPFSEIGTKTQVSKSMLAKLVLIDYPNGAQNIKKEDLLNWINQQVQSNKLSIPVLTNISQQQEFVNAALEEPPAAAEETLAAVEEPSVFEENTPTVVEEPPLIEEEPPAVVEEEPPAVVEEEPLAIVEDKNNEVSTSLPDLESLKINTSTPEITEDGNLKLNATFTTESKVDAEGQKAATAVGGKRSKKAPSSKKSPSSKKAPSSSKKAPSSSKKAPSSSKKAPASQPVVAKAPAPQKKASSKKASASKSKPSSSSSKKH